jgi:hypothetical protein
MTQDRTNHESHVLDTTDDAVVVTDELVTMWRDGQTVEVSSRSVPAMIEAGWLHGSPEAIPAVLAEIDLLLQEAGRNLHVYVDGASVDGSIDPQDEATYASAHKSLQLLGDRCAQLDTLMHAVYPFRQAPPAVVVVDGEERTHDPGQVAMLDPERQFRAIDPAKADDLVGYGWQKLEA